ALSATFLAGAFNSESDLGTDSRTFSGGTEYRDTFYAASPNSDLVQQASLIDISTDTFFNSPAEVNVDTSNYSCAAKASIELTMVRNDTLESALRPCFTNRLRQMEFCRNSTLVSQ